MQCSGDTKPFDDFHSLSNNHHVLTLDIGTTTIRSHVYNKEATLLAECKDQIHLLHPKPGWVEMDEEHLFSQIMKVIKQAILDANLTSKEITCLGICVQRNTFITWDKETGKPFHHFITWQDLRTSDLVRETNRSCKLKTLNFFAKLLYYVTRSNRFLGSSVLNFKSIMVILKLKWVYENIPNFKRRVAEDQVCFGTIETWLLWKLTEGKVFATEYSCVSSTCLFDTYQMCWSKILSWLIGYPLNMFPPIKDTSGFFGNCSAKFFGSEIPITAIVADQQSAMFGQCCFDVGDIKLSMGTASCITVNTGSVVHASLMGLYPLIGWKIGDDITYLAEGIISDTGRVMEWLKNIGFLNDVAESSDLAKSVENTAGVFFVAAFSGLQAPINDDRASTMMIGITYNSKREHIVRAVLESLAYRVKKLHICVKNETAVRTNFSYCKCDGGVCKNEFLMQKIADLIDCPMDVPENMEMSSLGAAFLAGLASGVWKNREELKGLRKSRVVVKPSLEKGEAMPVYERWLDAVKRARGWYESVNV